jgi:hypothetical protein
MILLQGNWHGAGRDSSIPCMMHVFIMLVGRTLMLFGRIFIKLRSLALLDGQRSLGAYIQACAQSIAEAFAHDTGNSIFKLYRTFSTGRYALATAVAA